MPAVQIYCDESGFSGNNLLNREQPYFVLGTVAIPSEEAADLVAKIRTDFRLQGAELKGEETPPVRDRPQSYSYGCTGVL
jgi:hypothetical protein